MKTSAKVLSILFLSFFLLSNHSFKNLFDDPIHGTWKRMGDHLVIKIIPETDQQYYSFIIDQGKRTFPCEVSSLPIYKNIVKKGDNYWECEFLFVDLNSCDTGYERGKMRITPEGELEVNCSGYSKKYYSKINPRSKSSD